MNTGNPFERLMAIPDEVERIKAAIVDMMDSLPENPLISKINANCFTLQFADIGTTNWTPFYHSFRMQAKHIQSRIKDIEPQFIIPLLKRIVETQSDYHQKYNYKFHPAFCRHLKTLIETYGVK